MQVWVPQCKKDIKRVIGEHLKEGNQHGERPGGQDL